MSSQLKEKSSPRTLLTILLASIFVGSGVVWLLFRTGLFQKSLPAVVLISIDTCRPDYLGCYGYPNEITPNIDRFAEKSVLFENVTTPVPSTLPAHCSMLTGTIPPYHGIHSNFDGRLGPSYTTIAEILKDRGFATGAIISAFVLDAQVGLNQGFDTYVDDYDPVTKNGLTIGRRAEETSRLACNWLQEHKNESFFLFIHYYDPHTPYDPPQPFASAFAGNPYAGEIAYTDKYIGRVIKKLKETDLYDSTLIIITADHGEMLGEHGEDEHSFFIYESAIKVPLIIKSPAGPKGKRISNIVNLVDIVPTICSFLGISAPLPVHGRNILSGDFIGRGTANEERYTYCESLAATKHKGNSLLGLVTTKWKYIQTTRPELYNLEEDKQEVNNLIVKQSRRARLMREHLKLILDEQSYKGEFDNTLTLDYESLKNLESLGYVAAGQTQKDYDFDQSKPDPKDLIGVYKQHKKLCYLIADQQYEKAKPLCAVLLASNPEDAALHSRMGKIAFNLGDMHETINCFSKALKIAGDSNSQVTINRSLIHQYLAQAFSRQNNYQEAVKHYTKALEIEPDSAVLYYDLGNAFLNQNKLDEAIKNYNKALALADNLPEVHYNLGNALYEQQKFEEAIIHFDKALKFKPGWQDARNNLQLAKTRKTIVSCEEMLRENPNQPYVHHNLGNIYLLGGNLEKADYHWNIALRLKPDWPEVLNNLAWLKAAHENEPFYDPNQAVQLALRACELTANKVPNMLDTLSTAYAATGRNNEAIETAEKALSLARSAKQHKLAEQIEKHLQLYKNGKP